MSTQPHIIHQQLEFVYRQLPLGLFVGWIGALLLVIIVHKDIPAHLLALWFSALIIVTVFRALIYFSYQRQAKKGEPSTRYLTAYLVGVCMSGITWGTTVYFIATTESISAILMIMLMLVGISAGAIAANAASFLGYALFITPVLAPLFAWMAMHTDREMNIASITAILYYAMLLLIARNFRKQYLAALNLSSENTVLITELSASNKMLAGEIEVRKKTEHELREAKSVAEAANQAKSTFLSHMSHELRTPLNAVIGFSELLAQDTTLAEEQKKQARIVLRAGHHLLDIISDVLDLAKIEAGGMQLALEHVCITNTIEECLVLMRPLAQARNVSLITQDLDAHRATRVIADSKRLKQIVLNLLSNAIKYNKPNGKVELVFHLHEKEVIVNIRDTGKGFSEDRIPELFEPFNRLGAENSDVEGTGIGLIITRSLLELMDGEIGLESEVGRGSTFWFSLPLVGPTQIDSPANETPGEDIDWQPPLDKRLLLAEDNIPNQMIIKKQLETLGCSVDVVENGRLALDEWLKARHKVVLTDCNMPEMDGYELAKEIRKHCGRDECIIIAITADAYSESIEKCLQAGMNDHISKPVTLETLETTIKRWCATVDR